MHMGYSRGMSSFEEKGCLPSLISPSVSEVCMCLICLYMADFKKGIILKSADGATVPEVVM